MSATVEELEALPEGAVVRSGIGEHAVKRHTGKWARWHNPVTVLTSADLAARYDQIEVLYPQPEPDHSMCARLVANDSRTYPWVIVHPNGDQGGRYLTERARELGYPVPVPDDRTVEERVIDALDDVLGHTHLEDSDLQEIANRLAELGLLAKDGVTDE